MEPWSEKIDLTAFWDDETITYLEKRDRIVATIRQSQWWRRQEEYSTLHDITAELGNAADEDEFDDWWDQLYDEADRDRVWIATAF